MLKDDAKVPKPPRTPANRPWRWQRLLVPLLLACALAMLAMVTGLLGAQLAWHAAGGAVLTAALVAAAAASWHGQRRWLGLQADAQAAAAQHWRLLDILPQMVWICDVNANAQYLNRRWMQFSGEPVERLLGDGWLGLLHPEDRERWMRDWREVQRSGADRLPDFRLRSTDGSYRWCSARFGVSRDAQGNALCWFGTSVDVHEVYEAHQTLARSDQFHRSMLAALNEGVIAYDSQARVTGCNPAAQRMLGLRAEEMLGCRPTDWALVLHDAQGRLLTPAQLALTNALVTGQPQRDMLMSITRPDGVQLWVCVNAEPVHGGPDGRLSAVVCSFGDVSAQHRELQAGLQQRDALELQVGARTRELQAMNRQLQQAERFARLVADSVPGRLVYWDGALRCRFVNRTQADWYGQPAEQLIGRSLREIRGDAGAALVAERAAAALAGQAQEFEHVECNARGVRADMRVQYIPDRRDGEVKGFVVLASDISDHKQAEQLLRLHNEQLEQSRDRADASNQAKSRFLANVSHEIRTPMNAILGFTHLLRLDIQDPLQQQRLSRIAGAGEHLLQLINDILDLSKIEAGKLTLECADFALDAVLARARAMVIVSALEKGLELRVSVEPVPVLLHGDATRLVQALLNLLNNAVKFTEFGVVALGVQVLSRDVDTLVLRFEVRDTGIGVDAQSLAELFTPFAQADSSRTRAHGGTGLGLAITRRIAEQMGGEAGVESAPGQGSCFWFTARLGIAACEPSGAPPPQRYALLFDARPAACDAGAGAAGSRVLIAEDNPVNREVAVQLLQRAGVTVEVAGDGEEALRMARNRPYDLVLMDMQMPRMDGLEATRRMRLEPALAQMPIVAMTANAFPEDRQACLDAGMNDHLAKPVDPRVLQAVLLRWLPAPPGRPPAPAVAPAQILARMADLVDLPQALGYAAGEPEILLRVLRQFVAHYRDMGATLVAQLEAADRAGPARGLHSLRGVSGMIGAGRLREMTMALEAALQSDAPPSTLHAQAAALRTELEALVAAMAARLS